MKNFFVYAVLALLLFGCGNKEEPPTNNPAVAVAESKAAAAEKERIRAEEKVKDAEQKIKVLQEEKSSLHIGMMGLVIVAAIALLVGIAIGSSSKKDAGKQRKSSNEQ
jgi:hypothetical protein